MFIFVRLELSRATLQPIHHGDGYYRGLSIRQTTPLLETRRTDISSGKVCTYTVSICSSSLATALEKNVKKNGRCHAVFLIFGPR